MRARVCLCVWDQCWDATPEFETDTHVTDADIAPLIPTHTHTRTHTYTHTHTDDGSAAALGGGAAAGRGGMGSTYGRGDTHMSCC